MSYILPLGPYHPALEEPVHVKLLTEGELIKDSEVFIGYNHRGIEKLTETRNFIQTITLVERVCGICSHSHAMTYCLAIEDIAGMEVPKSIYSCYYEWTWKVTFTLFMVGISCTYNCIWFIIYDVFCVKRKNYGYARGYKW